MSNKLTTPKAILIGSFMIAGTILYTSGNISNPIIRTAHATSHETILLNQMQDIIGLLKDIFNIQTKMKSILNSISRNTRKTL